jgi:hypothetical protein
MGWLSRRTDAIAAMQAANTADFSKAQAPTGHLLGPTYPRNIEVRSPWTVGALNPLVWNDIFGTETMWVSRGEAMTVPGVVKGRSVLVSLIADKPLIAYRDEERLDPQPRWLFWTAGQVSPWMRMTMTIDDLVFFGWSLWGRKNGSRGEILDAWRIPAEFWQFDANGRVLVRDDETGEYQPVDDTEVILFQGPSAGLLATATRTLRGAAELEQAWIKRAKNPIPAIDLHETVESGMTETEAQEVVDGWAAARSDPNGAIAYTPYNVEARALGQLSPDMFIEARNFIRLDIAAFFALPAAMLDASLSTASLTYSTQEGKFAEVFGSTLPYWMRPIEARLSQDDVVPNGQSIKFDISSVVPGLRQPPIPTED